MFYRHNSQLLSIIIIKIMLIKKRKKKYLILLKKNYEKYGYINEFSDVVNYEQALEEFKRIKNFVNRLIILIN